MTLKLGIKIEKKKQEITEASETDKRSKRYIIQSRNVMRNKRGVASGRIR